MGFTGDNALKITAELKHGDTTLISADGTTT
jgi:hypothetical protein